MLELIFGEYFKPIKLLIDLSFLVLALYGLWTFQDILATLRSIEEMVVEIHNERELFSE